MINTLERILVEREQSFRQREQLFRKIGKSVHVQTGISVHVKPETVFTFGQNHCSRWAGICTIICKLLILFDNLWVIECQNERLHRGEDIAKLANRHEVYEKAKAANPERWSGKTRNWEHQAVMALNPVKAAEAVS